MKNARPQTTEASALDKSNCSPADLFPETLPAFCPKWPRPGTHPGDVLARMLTGERLTQPSFGFHGWRLAAYVQELEYLGWPVAAADVPPPAEFKGTRPIRQYWLPRDTIATALEMKGFRQ